jgi:hypothetical protein
MNVSVVLDWFLENMKFSYGVESRRSPASAFSQADFAALLKFSGNIIVTHNFCG